MLALILATAILSATPAPAPTGNGITTVRASHPVDNARMLQCGTLYDLADRRFSEAQAAIDYAESVIVTNDWNTFLHYFAKANQLIGAGTAYRHSGDLCAKEL